MNTQQIAEHIVLGHYGRRQHRKAVRAADAQRRSQDHSRPRWWVMAHINSRADFPSGYLAELVANPDPTTRDHWQQYLTKSRTAYRASRN